MFMICCNETVSLFTSRASQKLLKLHLIKILNSVTYLNNCIYCLNQSEELWTSTGMTQILKWSAVSGSTHFVWVICSFCALTYPLKRCLQPIRMHECFLSVHTKWSWSLDLTTRFLKKAEMVHLNYYFLLILWLHPPSWTCLHHNNMGVPY